MFGGWNKCLVPKGIPAEEPLRTGTVRIPSNHAGFGSKNLLEIVRNWYHKSRVLRQIRDFVPDRIPQESEIANKEEFEDFLQKSGREETMLPINELTLPI